MKQLRYVLLSGLMVGSLAFAQSATVLAAEQITEAENMTREYGTQEVWSDSTASGGKKRILWNNGAAYGTLKASGGFTQIDIRAKGDHYGSAYPKVDVWVDHVFIKTISLDSEYWKTFSVTGNWAAGDHRLYLEYTNDHKHRGVILDSAVAANVTTPTEPTPTEPVPTIPGDNTNGSGGAKTDQTFLSYSNGTYTSRYHLYAAGLDWTKPVGALIYADGSGEYGLKNPSSTYLLAGTNGLVNVAKRNNMVLITPFAPNTACADGGGSCWYQGDSVGYTKWAESLVQDIYTKYPIDKSRVAMGGYSSGAQLAARYWTPSGAAQRTMNDGVIVSISCGGNPAMTETTYTTAFKANVHMNWNTGDQDDSCPHTATWSTNGGYTHYTNLGFNTSRDILPGVTHNRSGQFGNIVEAQIKEHVKL